MVRVGPRECSGIDAHISKDVTGESKYSIYTNRIKHEASENVFLIIQKDRIADENAFVVTQLADMLAMFTHNLPGMKNLSGKV